MYYLSTTNNMHTYHKHKRVYDINCMKARDSKGIHVYLLDLNKNCIYMKQNMKIGKTSVNEGIIKTRLYMCI